MANELNKVPGNEETKLMFWELKMAAQNIISAHKFGFINFVEAEKRLLELYDIKQKRKR